MTPFEHLSVLISIVLGLGLAHMLTTLHELIQARARVRVYWLSIVWFVLIFISLIEWWWASFALRTTLKWNFFYFLFILLSPISMYLAAAFVLPTDSERDDRIIDLREYYFSNSAWFFGILAVSPALDAIRRALQAGSFFASGAASNAISAVLLTSVAVVKRPWYHVLITVIVGGLFLSFIVSSALELR
ncbi:MAG: hypothetical protein V4550_03445 [Gemmatimonadota bacterium]